MGLDTQASSMDPLFYRRLEAFMHGARERHYRPRKARFYHRALGSLTIKIETACYEAIFMWPARSASIVFCLCLQVDPLLESPNITM